MSRKCGCCNNNCSCWMKCCGGEDKSTNRDENGENYNCVNTYGCVEFVEGYNYGFDKKPSNVTYRLFLSGSAPNDWINGISVWEQSFYTYTMSHDSELRIKCNSSLVRSIIGTSFIESQEEDLEGDPLPTTIDNYTILSNYSSGGKNIILYIVANATINGQIYSVILGNVGTNIDISITYDSFKERLYSQFIKENSNCSLDVWTGQLGDSNLICSGFEIDFCVYAIIPNQDNNDVSNRNIVFNSNQTRAVEVITSKCTNITAVLVDPTLLGAGLSFGGYYPFIGRLPGLNFTLPSAPKIWGGEVNIETFVLELKQTSFLYSSNIGNKGKCTYSSPLCIEDISIINGWRNVNLRCPVKNSDCGNDEVDGSSWDDLLINYNGEHRLGDLKNGGYVINLQYTPSLPNDTDVDFQNFVSSMSQTFAIGNCGDLKILTNDKVEFADVGILTISGTSANYRRYKFYTIKEYLESDVSTFGSCLNKSELINNTCTSCSSVWYSDIGYIDRKLTVTVSMSGYNYEFDIYYNPNTQIWSSSTVYCENYADSYSENLNILYRNSNVTLDIVGRNCVLDIKSITPEYDSFIGPKNPLPLNLIFTLPLKSCIYHIGDVIITQDSFKSPLQILGVDSIVYITGTGSEATYAQ